MKKRIAFISEHASPLALLGGVDSGGQNVYVSEVAIELAKKGWLVDVFTRRDDSSLQQIVQWAPGVRVVHITAGPEHFIEKELMMGHMPAFAENMIGFILEQNIRYEMVHANFFMSAMVASIVKNRLNIPYVVTFHALGLVRKMHQKEQDRFPEERCTVERFIVQDADRIIAECPQDEEDLVKHYNTSRDKIDMIPCGFNPREFYPIHQKAARKKLHLTGPEKLILHIGRMVKRKGVENIIRSIACMNGHETNVKLMIVGGESDDPDPIITPEIGRLQQLASELGVAERVIFTGRRSREQLKYYYAAADVFVTTPWYEPFGITPLEAMACGAPVIGSNVGGIKYSIVDGETGFLVPANQPQILANKIIDLVFNPLLLQQLRANAVQRVNESFTWQKVAEQLQCVYKKILQPGKQTQKASAHKTFSLRSSIENMLDEPWFPSSIIPNT